MLFASSQQGRGLVVRMLFRILLIFLILSPAAAWAFYKPVRVLAPELAGVSCVSEHICTDDASRRADTARLYDEAYAFVTASVGAIEDKPRVIFCASRACFRSFGFDRASAHTVGVSGIVVAPRGWTDHVLRHEMIHHLQAERLGVIRQWRMPDWFSEGMAHALGEDPRPALGEPWQGHRARFRRWYRSVGKENFWQEARRLWP